MVLPIILSVFAGLIGLVWTGRHIKIFTEKRYGFLLTDQYAGPPEPAPSASLIVAAKDEENNIDSCVRSLLSQDYPDFEIIAVNDRSDDRTGEILDSIAAEDDRLTVIHIDTLPDGWKGKNHAMHAATQVARGEVLFFTDADCQQTSPRTISVAMQLMKDRQAGMLTMLPNLAMKGFWENVIQPLCSGVMMVWFEPTRVNNPRRKAAYANGAFMLTYRNIYDQIGGHEAVRNVLQEDMELGKRVKESGLGLAVTRSLGLYTVRMYTSLQEIFHGWTRIFYGSFTPLRRVIISLLVVAIMCLGPLIVAGLGFCRYTTGQGWPLAAIVGGISVFIQLSLIYRFYKLIYANKYLFWTYPLGCLIVMAILIAAIAKHRPGAKVTWKNTQYTPQ
ncbi:MAG: glycosyltransferase [Phycisphaerae bacterium]|nr:glycosyltransferase [Phycisphaerae bacterium]